MKSDFIWMNGELVPFEKATVHFLNPTMHYGMGIFEGIRCYATSSGPAIFRVREHIRRLIKLRQLLIWSVACEDDVVSDAELFSVGYKLVHFVALSFA